MAIMNWQHRGKTLRTEGNQLMGHDLDDDEAFLAAFDRREAERLLSSERVEIAARGGGKSLAVAERKRVAALIERDRADRAQEQYRDEARQRFENGDSASSADAVIPPTPEWLGKGEVESFLPHQDKNSTRLVKTVRRWDLPIVRKMMLSDKINFEGYRACKWYRELYETTGLSGSIPSVDLQREVHFSAHKAYMFSDRQEEVQDEFRAVRQLINNRFILVLDAIALYDMPVYLVRKAARVRIDKVGVFFRLAVDDLVAARDAITAQC